MVRRTRRERRAVRTREVQLSQLVAGPKYDIDVTDQRMLWVRNVAGIAASGVRQTIDAEFASETRIFGGLEYANTFTVAATTLRPDTSGLWKYTLRLSYPEPPATTAKATKQGYVFREGPVGELLAAMAFHLECRLFLVSTVDSQPGNNFAGLKTEYAFHRGVTGPAVDPVVFSSNERNFAKGLSPFLDLLLSIHPRHHFAVAMALSHYARALREVGVDDEMVFIRLVSAIEAVAEEEDGTPDPLMRKALAALAGPGVVGPDEREEFSKLLQTRKLKRRFIAFLVQHSVGFFRGGRWKAPHTRVTRKALPEVAGAVYDARSGYLHRGDPMYISRYWPEASSWQTDATVGMVWQSRRYTAKQKLPYAHFFHRLVRHCLLNYFTGLPRVPATVAN